MELSPLSGLPNAMTPDRVERWPQDFPIPTFFYEIELVLGEGDVDMREKERLSSCLGNKSMTFLKFLQLKCIVSIGDRDVSVVAEALVTKHPCLKEPGSQTGQHGCKNRTFKMGNYHAKLSRV